MRVSLPSFVAGVLAATVLAVVPATALVVHTAAVDPNPNTYDGTSPTLTLAPVEFVTGSSIDDAPAASTEMCTSHPWNYNVPLRMRWSSADTTSGLAGYDVWGVGSNWDGYGKLADDTTATSYVFAGTNYRGDCGGGGMYNNQYWVSARDNKGNTAASRQVGQHVSVWDENGVTPNAIESNLAVTRTGTWSTAGCTCFNTGKTSYSTAKNASVSYKVTSTAAGEVVALVMEKASNRGTVNISVDGGTATAVSTNATTTAHRVVVWQKALALGTHTIKLTNAGTAGHGRVDVDAIMLTLGASTEQAGEPTTN
jgi:hypothetical protein